jgi:hypothetical protein
MPEEINDLQELGEDENEEQAPDYLDKSTFSIVC